MMSPVIVSGPLRSGTSLVASMLHYMGCPMCVTMMAPDYPRWKSEWEDVPVSYETHEAFPLGVIDHRTGNKVKLARWMHDYMEERRVIHTGIAAQWGRPAPVCVGAKSPLFLFAWEQLKQALPRVKTIIIHRDPGATHASILSSYPPDLRKAAMDTNDALHELAGHERASLDIRYDEILAHPYDSAELLGLLVGIEDKAALARAASVVRTRARHGKIPAMEA